MNAANLLTLLRLVLTAPIVVLMNVDGLAAAWVAFGLFLVAMLTDVFDGMLARRCPNRSPLGNYLDPVADKVLLMSLFITLTCKGIVPAWMVVILVAREFVVDGVRAAGAVQGKLVGSNWMGKTKTTIETLAISFALCGIALKASGVMLFTGVHDVLWCCGRDFLGLAWWLTLIATVAATVFAGVFMYWNRGILGMRSRT